MNCSHRTVHRKVHSDPGFYGNIATDTSVSPLGRSAGNAVTSYSYDGTYDFVNRIVGPNGEVWRASIDGSTGNRSSEALTDTGSVHSTSYRYDSTREKDYGFGLSF